MLTDNIVESKSICDKPNSTDLEKQRDKQIALNNGSHLNEKQEKYQGECVSSNEKKYKDNASCESKKLHCINVENITNGNCLLMNSEQQCRVNEDAQNDEIKMEEGKVKENEQMFLKNVDAVVRLKFESNLKNTKKGGKEQTSLNHADGGRQLIEEKVETIAVEEAKNQMKNEIDTKSSNNEDSITQSGIKDIHTEGGTQSGIKDEIRTEDETQSGIKDILTEGGTQSGIKDILTEGGTQSGIKDQIHTEDGTHKEIKNIRTEDGTQSEIKVIHTEDETQKGIKNIRTEGGTQKEIKDIRTEGRTQSEIKVNLTVGGTQKEIKDICTEDGIQSKIEDICTEDESQKEIEVMLTENGTPSGIKNIRTEDESQNEIEDDNIDDIIDNGFVNVYAGKTSQIPDFAVIFSFLDLFGDFLELPYISINELEDSIDSTKELAVKDNEGPIEVLHTKLLRKLIKSPKFSSAAHVKREKLLNYVLKFCQLSDLSCAWDLQQFGYHILTNSQRLLILKSLCEVQFDENLRFRTAVQETYKADPGALLRLVPFGFEQEGLYVWFQQDKDLNVRVYAGEEEDEETWQIRAGSIDDLEFYISKLKSRSEINPKDTAAEKIRELKMIKQQGKDERRAVRAEKRRIREEKMKLQKLEQPKKTRNSRSKKKKVIVEEVIPMDELSSEVESEPEDDGCARCYANNQADLVLLCDSCDAAYHTLCLRPPVTDIPEGDWYCPFCQQLQLIEKLQVKYNELRAKFRARERKSKRLGFYGIKDENILEQNSDDNLTRRSSRNAKRVDYNYKDFEQTISEAVSENGGTRKRHADSNGDTTSLMKPTRKSSRGDCKRRRKLNNLSDDDENSYSSGSDYVASDNERRRGNDMRGFLVGDDYDELEEKYRNKYLRRSSRNKSQQESSLKASLRHGYSVESSSDSSDSDSNRFGVRRSRRKRTDTSYKENFSDESDVACKTNDNDGGNWGDIDGYDEEDEESGNQLEGAENDGKEEGEKRSSIRKKKRKVIESDISEDEEGDDEEIPYDDESDANQNETDEEVYDEEIKDTKEISQNPVNSLPNTKSKSQGIECGTENIESKTQDIESKTQDIESKTQDIESKTQVIESKTQVIESKTQVIESKTQDRELNILKTECFSRKTDNSPDYEISHKESKNDCKEAECILETDHSSKGVGNVISSERECNYIENVLKEPLIEDGADLRKDNVVNKVEIQSTSTCEIPSETMFDVVAMPVQANPTAKHTSLDKGYIDLNSAKSIKETLLLNSSVNRPKYVPHQPSKHTLQKKHDVMHPYSSVCSTDRPGVNPIQVHHPKAIHPLHVAPNAPNQPYGNPDYAQSKLIRPNMYVNTSLPYSFQRESFTSQLHPASPVYSPRAAFYYNSQHNPHNPERPHSFTSAYSFPSKHDQPNEISPSTYPQQIATPYNPAHQPAGGPVKEEQPWNQFGATSDMQFNLPSEYPTHTDQRENKKKAKEDAKQQKIIKKMMKIKEKELKKAAKLQSPRSFPTSSNSSTNSMSYFKNMVISSNSTPNSSYPNDQAVRFSPYNSARQ